MPNPQVERIRQLVSAQLAGADRSLAGMRSSVEALGGSSPLPAGVTHEAIDAGGVAAEWNRPQGADGGRALLYLLGGGYMLGSIASSRGLISRIAIAAGAPALSVGYRLAPEHPFPAALDDAVAAYRWLLGTGVEAKQVAIVGTSAGAGLALAMALRVRDHEADLELPGALVCMSAWVDLRYDSTSLAQANDPFLDKAVVTNMALAYLAGREPTDPLASPLHAQLAGLPPLLLQAGGAEGLRDENETFAAKAGEAGVDVSLEIWDDMLHAWQVFALMLDDAQRAIDRGGAFIRERTGGR